MQLKEIHWPVYKLKDLKPSTVDGIVFYSKRDKDGSDTIEIIDDKNIPAPTLANRRLQIDVTYLYKLKQALFFLSDLLKVYKKGQWFIDSNGNIFSPSKTRSTKLVFKKITNILRGTMSCTVEVEELPGRYMSLFPPGPDQKYAGLLQLDSHTYILYGFFKEKHKDSRRMI